MLYQSDILSSANHIVVNLTHLYFVLSLQVLNTNVIVSGLTRPCGDMSCHSTHWTSNQSFLKLTPNCCVLSKEALNTNFSQWFNKNTCKHDITVFTVFRLLTDFVCLYNYEFGLSLCKIVRSSVILLLPLFQHTILRSRQSFLNLTSKWSVLIRKVAEWSFMVFRVIRPYMYMTKHLDMLSVFPVSNSLDDRYIIY